MLSRGKIKKLNPSENTAITISLNGQTNTSGLQQEIDRYINTETNQSINPVTDIEKFIYRQKSDTSYTFDFINFQGDYVDLLTTQGFTANEITGGSASIQNSFYIVQYYDSSDLDNQILLHQSYLHGFQFYTVGVEAIYNPNIINNSEFAEIYLSENFVENKDDEFTIYARYYFFNSKQGELIPMLATENENDTTSSRLFYEVTIDKLLRNFTIETQSPVSLREVRNASYRIKIDDTIDKQPRERQNPPAGTGFNNIGEYIELP